MRPETQTKGAGPGLLARLLAWLAALLARLRGGGGGGGGPLPPGPAGLPLVGCLPWLDPAAPHLSLARLARIHGPVFGLKLGGVYAVVVSDHRLVRRALASPAFAGRAPLFLTHGIMQGHGIICAEGALWKDQRKFVSTCLKNFGMVKFGLKRAKLEQRIMCGVKACLQELRSTAAPRDPLHALHHCLGNVVNSLVFGRTWADDDPVWRWLRHLQEEGTKLIGVAGPLNFLPFLRFLPRYRRMMEFLVTGKQKTHDVYRALAEERLRSGEDLEQSEDVMAAFLVEMSRRKKAGDQGAAAGGEDFYTAEQFHHLLADLFGAGVDTTLATLRWFLLFVAADPDLQARVQEELDGALGPDGRLPTLDDAASLPLTSAALAETQRIRSVVPLGIPHGALEDTELAGYSIPRGTMLVPLQWAVHMDPDLWPRPEVFDPSRFLAEDGSFRRPEAFMPFQTGKRTCVGEDLARMLLFLFGAAILRRFRVRPPGGAPVDLEGEAGITLTPRPQPLVFEPRS
ncbi:cytochrome P450 306a1 [Bacillus rossius redtenbacheri]|uniref:cytochrome P450 306a1 n=1 Tax=Bacillus rossius redtenbacheri TaxID=93214 RepID=UPI002FDD757C